MTYRSAERLLLRAEAELNQVTAESGPDSGFLHAHMAALRAAAAIVQGAGPVTPARSRRRVRSVWEQLGEVSPTWQAWAGHFAQHASMRAAIESGRPSGLTSGEAEEAITAATDFVALARAAVAAADAPMRLAS